MAGESALKPLFPPRCLVSTTVSSWEKTFHPNRKVGSSARRPSHTEGVPGAEVMGLSRKGRAYGAAGAVSERAESGRSARAQAGALRQRGAPLERAAESAETAGRRESLTETLFT